MTPLSAYASATVGNTLVVVWNGEPDVVALQRVFRELEAHCRTCPKALIFNVITQSTGIPGAEARELLRDMFSRVRGRVAAMSIVLEKDGVEGSLSRAILTTLVTLSRRPFELRTFAVRSEAAFWLSRHDACPPADTLTDAASRLEKRLAAQTVAGDDLPRLSRRPGAS